MDPKELRALAKARAEQAERLEELARLREREAELMKELGLPSVSNYDNTLDTMSSSEAIIPTRVGPKFSSKHPLPTKARLLGKSIKSIADDLEKALRRSVARTTVRSWYATDKESARAIPEDAVKFFEAKPWSIPRSAWKNGISDGS